MKLSGFNHYLLVAPIGIAFLGLALIVAWRFQQDQKNLLWMALGLIVTSISLGIQSAVPPQDISKYAVYTSFLYLFGAWLASCSIADKFNANFYPRTAALITIIALGFLYYYSQVVDSVTTRVYILCIALGVLQILPARQIFNNKPIDDKIELFLYWLYLIFCIYTMARPLIFFSLDNLDFSDLSRSQYWFFTLLGSMIVCMTFTFLLLACSIRKAFRKLTEERNHDPLTELLNRRAFKESAEIYLNNPRSYPVSILVCDIDHFKKINDTWGHDSGDDVLRYVGLTLRQSTRNRDLVVRIGGEEFLLFLTNTTLDVAKIMAQRIREKLRSDRHVMAVHEPITMSFGLVALKEGERLSDAVKRADIELYKAKNLGRNRICSEQDLEISV